MHLLYCAKSFFKILNCFQSAFCFQCHKVCNRETSIPAEIWPQEGHMKQYVTHCFPPLPLCFSGLHTFTGTKKNFFGWFEINRWSNQWRKTVFSFVEGLLNICFQIVPKLFKDSSIFFIFYIASTVSHMRNIQLIVNTIQFNIIN